MTLYTGTPSCLRCGGSLRSDDDTCPCGGRSQYATPVPSHRELSGVAAALAEMDRRREPPAS